MTTSTGLLVNAAVYGAAAVPVPSRVESSTGPVAWHIAHALGEADQAELRELWSADPSASAFTSPAFLQSCSEHASAAGSTPVFARGQSRGRTVAVWPLVIDSSRRMTLLQTEHADHSTCLRAPGVDAATLGEGLAHALSVARPREFSVVRVPPWGQTLEAIRSGLTQSGWLSSAFPVLASPVITTAPGPGAADAFHAEFHRHSRLRTKENRVKRMPGYAFEVLDDDTDLESWAREFCDVHEWRWNTTDTPSRLRHNAARGLFIEQLRAWIQDGVLRRFAIRIDNQRHAFATCLVGGDRLLYHQIATRPGNGPLSLGKVLLRMIGVWASRNGVLTLDLGMGDESYKFEFARQTDMLWKVYAAPRPSVALTVNALKQRIHETPKALDLWKRWVHGFVRGQVIPMTLRSRRTVYRLCTERRRTWNGLVRLGGVGSRRTVVYAREGGASSASPDVRLLSTPELVGLLNSLSPQVPEERGTALGRAYQGAQAVALFQGERPVMAVWLIAPEVPGQSPSEEPCWQIEPLLFRKGSRTPGALARLLSVCGGMIPPTAQVIVTVPHHTTLHRELTAANFRAVDARPVARAGDSVEKPANGDHGE